MLPTRTRATAMAGARRAGTPERRPARQARASRPRSTRGALPGLTGRLWIPWVVMRDEATFRVKAGLAEMLKGGVIMDVVDAEQAKIAEDAGAAAVMALERVPADI